MITLPQGWDGANNFHIHNFSEKIPNWRTSLTAFFAMRIRHISIRFSEVTCFEDLITCPVEVIVAYQRRIPESEIFLLAWNVQERWVLGWLPHDKREGFLHSPICEAPTHTVSIEILGPFTKSARLGISKIYTTAYHPQTNAFNRFISTNLSLHTQKNQKDWDCNIPACRVVYLTAVHDATGSSPCFLVFGRRPRIAFEILLTLPAKLHEEDWNAYNVEQTCHLRRAYDMVTECDHFQRQKDVRL